MELNYKQFGQGEPLIILHGLFGMLDNWESIARRLAEDYTVFIVDQRNHGKSPRHPDFDYLTLAEDLHAFMEQQWIYRAHLLGHSMGGKTVMQFALNYPDMVDRLIVVDIAPKRYQGGHTAIFEALFALDLGKLENRKQAEEQLANRIPDIGTRQFLLKNLRRSKEGGYAWKMNLPVLHIHYQNILGNIDGELADMPCLFIRGEYSSYIKDEDWHDIHRLFPAANIQTISHAGHWVHADQPEELLEMVRAFLA